MTFEEDFPSLKVAVFCADDMCIGSPSCADKSHQVVRIGAISFNTIDKQKVRDVIAKRRALGEPEVLKLALDAIEKELGL
jgi:hypothetical protein